MTGNTVKGAQLEVPTQDKVISQDNLEKIALSPKPGDYTEHDTAAEKPHATHGEVEPGYLMKFLLCAVAALEGADNLLMPATMFALQESGIMFEDLVYLGGMQAVCTNIAGPLWGMLADSQTISRRNILIGGSLGQGAVTVLLAFTTDLFPMVILRGMNGIMLSSLRPISNGVVADCTSDSLRGKIFGQIQSAMVMGMLFTSLVATPIARQTVVGYDGWRVAFVLIGSLSIVVSALLLRFFEDLGNESVKESRGFWAVLHELRCLFRFFKIPTFSVMILQGIFGTIPWAALGFMTLFFQLSGMTDAQATFLQTEGLVVGIFGNMLGGIVADWLAHRFGYHGRPLNAQITVAVGMPLIFAMFVGITPGEGDFVVYALLLLTWSLFGCWAQSGTNFPILCEIVPADARCRILSWECCFENTIASAIAPFVIALVSKELGYTFGEEKGSKIESATALGQAMTIIVVGPGLVCLTAYSMLHFTYPRDIRRLQELALTKSQQESSSQKCEREN